MFTEGVVGDSIFVMVDRGDASLEVVLSNCSWLHISFFSELLLPSDAEVVDSPTSPKISPTFQLQQLFRHPDDGFSSEHIFLSHSPLTSSFITMLVFLPFLKLDGVIVVNAKRSSSVIGEVTTSVNVLDVGGGGGGGGEDVEVSRLMVDGASAAAGGDNEGLGGREGDKDLDGGGIFMDDVDDDKIKLFLVSNSLFFSFFSEENERLH
mmetsp:Transcript_22244/g.32731  ORF Transcript_22244/g.32731 Transcript_22244/m.32731 type:complete len:208 (+) Transcript_22244:835-1458(+)